MTKLERQFQEKLEALRDKAESARITSLKLYEANEIDFPDVAAMGKILADRACGELDAYNNVKALLDGR